MNRRNFLGIFALPFVPFLTRFKKQEEDITCRFMIQLPEGKILIEGESHIYNNGILKLHWKNYENAYNFCIVDKLPVSDRFNSNDFLGRCI